MSGIFGIFNRHDNSIEEKTVNTMLDAMSYWEPDERDTWIDGPVTLGHIMLWNTPESKYEHLPLNKETYVLTMDARIDNRDELFNEVDLPDRSLEEIGDSEFILSAYRKWGEDCPKHLLGDFAFAIWDEKKEQLFCARDHVGIKPFYFYLDNDLFVFSNDMQGILVHPDISKDLLDESVANYLVNSMLISTTDTFYKNIKKLNPAHTLIIKSSEIKKNCYWKAENALKINFPNEKAYADKLRQLLEQTVYDRMRSNYPIASHLSGGLDSSSIAVIAARKLHEKDEKLIAFNWLHEPTESDDSTYYEWSNSKCIAEAEDIDHSYVSISEADMLHYIKNHNIKYGDSAGFWYEYPVQEAAKSKNVRTMLSGWDGDGLISYHGMSYYSNMVQQGKLIRVLKEIKKIVSKKSMTFKNSVSFFYNNVLIPFVPRRFYCRMPKSKCGTDYTFQVIKKDFLPIIYKELEKTTDLTMQPQSIIRDHMLAYFNEGHLQSRIDSWSASSFVNRLEYRYPLLDKRIIEFALGVPAELFVHNGRGRYLFRSAIQGLLPEKVLWSNSKQEPHRVNRLLSLLSVACKEEIYSIEKDQLNSKYIDTQKLKKLSEKTLEMQDIGTVVVENYSALAIVQCEN